MVFESVVVDVLNRYLRPYVKHLDPSQIKVGVWKGHAHLGNLELKEDLFEEFDIPVRIKSSYIGKLEAKIPWKNLTKDPLYVTIDEVYIIVGPNIDTHYDAERDLKRKRKEKEKKIEHFEESAKKRKKKEKEAKKKKKKEKKDSFTEKLVTNLLKNMEVKVRDIHVRYEDSSLPGATTLAAGLTLHSLDLKSADANWRPAIVRETATLIYKLLELNCLGVYWNTTSVTMATLPQTDMLEAMREAIARPALAPPPSIEYLLKPMSANARLQLSLKPGADMTIPQVGLDVHVQDILVSLHETQFKSLLNTMDTFDRHVVNLKFLKYRPGVGVKERPGQWWRYAISAVTEEEVRRKLEMWSWSHIKQHRKTFKLYRDKYREKVKSVSTSSSLQKQLRDLEDQLDWFNIVIARREAKKGKVKAASSSKKALPTATPTPAPAKAPPIQTRATPPTEVAHGEAKKEPASQETEKVAKKKEKKGLFANFRAKLKGGKKDEGKSGSEKRGGEVKDGGKKAVAKAVSEASKTGEEEGEKEEAVAEEERGGADMEQLYKAIGYSEDEEYEELPREYVAHKITVNLNKVSVELSGKKELATLVTKGVTASILNRPSSKAVSVSASVAGLEMRGIPKSGVDDPNFILSTAATTSDLSTPLVKLELELNPLNSDFDLDIRASLQPLQITYDAETVDGLIGSFKVRKNIHLQELTGAASATAEELRNQTSSGLQGALKNKKQMRLDVTLHSPYLVLPQGGHLGPQSSLLVVDLGTLSIAGNTRGHQIDDLPQDGDQLARYYDNFTLKLQGMQALVAKPGEDWQSAKLQGRSSLHILNPTGLQLQLKQSIVKKDAYLPSVKIEGDIPGFEVTISDQKVVTILQIVTTLQLPPPSLANTTTYYDNIPAPTIAKQTSVVGVTSSIMDTMSFSSYLEDEDDDEDEDEEEEEEGDTYSQRSRSLSPSDGEAEKAAVDKIFTDAQIELVIRKIGVRLTEVGGGGGGGRERTLVVVSVEDMKAEVVDRSWDTQGTVTMGNVSILDHISMDSKGAPTVLLRTKGLSDGNFISTKFITVTNVGKAFAEKYTGFSNSVTADLSLVEITMQRETLATLLKMGLALKTAIGRADVKGTAEATPTLATPPLPAIIGDTHTINPNDFENVGEVATKKKKEMNFKAKFEGINVQVVHGQLHIVHTQVSGFSVEGKDGVKVLSLTASMEDVLVEDPQSSQQSSKIVSRTDPENMIKLEVSQYKLSPQERVPVDLSWSDTSILAQIQRVKVQLDTGFLNRILDFAKNLRIDSDALRLAARATADTATAAATAIRESEKTAHRVKLDVSLRAPLVLLPYSIKHSTGTISIDLGDFRVRNRLVWAESLLSPLTTVAGGRGKTTFDVMEIKSTAIQITRTSTSRAGITSSDAKSFTILEPVQFTATISRNLGTPLLVLPNIDIKLPLNIIKFHLHEEDVMALITVALSATQITQVLSPPPKHPSSVTSNGEKSVGKVSPRVQRPGSEPEPSRPALSRMDSMVEIQEVRVQASLQSVSLDFTTNRGPLLNAISSAVMANVGVYKEMVKVKASVDSLGVTDSTSRGNFRKMVSLSENTDKASSLEIKLDTRKERQILEPMGEVRTRIAQVRFMVFPSFLQHLLEFVQRLKEINTKFVINAAKLGKDGAQAITSKAWDKYLIVDVETHAPVLILPVSETSRQAFMVDLGSVSVKNMLLPLDEGAGIEAYGVNLDSLKASRVLMDVEGGYRVECERVLFQPFHVRLALERNLCSAWYTKRPTLSLNCQMGEFKMLVGEEDLKQLVALGKNFGQSLSGVMEKGSKKGAEVREAIMEGLTAGEEERRGGGGGSVGGGSGGGGGGGGGGETEVTDMIKITSSLISFELKLFKDEPLLSIEDKASVEVEDTYSLASVRLVSMALDVLVQSNQDVKLDASLRDIVLTDLQPSQQQKKTGTRVVQHYTSNPLEAYTGRLDTPLVKISYILRDGQHIVILNAQNILVLSDIQFLTTLSDHFQSILGDESSEKLSVAETTPMETSIMSVGSPVDERTETLDLNKKKKNKTLPKMKVEASLTNIRVAIVEDIDDPQALTLQLKMVYLNLQLSEMYKQASVNVADVSIAASSFFSLDQVNKWILLPSSMRLTMTGPLDQPAMDINATVEPISLTLSPSIIRLVVHAINSIVPKKKVQRAVAPSDLWGKKRIEGQRFWFLKPVAVNRTLVEKTDIDTTEKKGEILSVDVKSVEVILESEGAGKSRGYPILAVNVSAEAQVSEWTGDLKVNADVHCEASYYNEKLSVWEPLLEPLEDRKTGRLSPWCLTAEVTKKKAVGKTGGGGGGGGGGGEKGDETEANISVSLSAKSPLQLTLSKTSLELLKSLAKAYTKEYERRLGNSADVEKLTGSPFTIVNKLGGKIGMHVQPGPSLKLKNKSDHVKLEVNESVDLVFVKGTDQKSYASLLVRPGEEEHTVNLAIGTFKPLSGVVISNPGCFYFSLELKKSTKPVHYGVVVDVEVTGTKKTITLRSPVQFHNHLQISIDLLTAPAMSRGKRSKVATIPADESYPVPIDIAQQNVFYIVPADVGLEPQGPPIAWFEKPGRKYVDSRCSVPGDSEPCHFIRVLFEEESYSVRRHLPTEDFAHHIFHLHPPLLLQNLLPSSITTGDIGMGVQQTVIEPGEIYHSHDTTPDDGSTINVSVSQAGEENLLGKLKFTSSPKKYTDFPVSSSDNTTIVLSVLTEDLGYQKVSIFSPYWMLNKTERDIEYLVDGKSIKHPSSKSLVLLSTDNPKNNIQIRTRTPAGRLTDWTLKFSLNAVGTSGNFPARFGQELYTFGVEARLSQFTLTKIVNISPYHTLINETEATLYVSEASTPDNPIQLPPGELVPFWPVVDGNMMKLSLSQQDLVGGVSFNYKRPDTICLRLDNELQVLCVDVQESESAIITHFTPYYPGCVPVQIINHFPDITLKFKQDTKQPNDKVYTLEPGETMYYTWDHPNDRRVIRWGLDGVHVRDYNPIYTDKDCQQTIRIKREGSSGAMAGVSSDTWLDIDNSFNEKDVNVDETTSETSSVSSYSSSSRGTAGDGGGGGGGGGELGARSTSKVYWKSFISGIQRVVLFTPFLETVERIKSVGSYSPPQVEVSLALTAVGLSLVENRKKRELAYIAITQSGVIWQVEKSRKWKTLNTAMIELLEGAYIKKERDIKYKNVSVNLETMQMFSPVNGRLRRTHHDGVHVKFAMSERDYSIHAKVGYIQVDNQLPFSVYPQVLYPLPPPPTVASDTEPKPFVEASIILRKKDDQSNVQHFKYVHVLVQKMAVNADLGFLLAVVAFLSNEKTTIQLEAEYVRSDIEETKKSLKDTIVPALSKDLDSSKSFFDVLHIAPIKMVVSFNVRSVGKNKEGTSMGDTVLELFLHSLGAILTSIQDTEMKFSLFHMEYQMKTGRALTRKLIKHYRTQALVELYTLVLGLDVLGNPVNVVRGVVGGTIDLFYEPIKGSVLGPEEFLEGLGIGLKSFVGGTVGGLTGAGAKITGAVGDVFAKLTFDEQFQDKRQQQKTKPPRLGSKLGGFAKNVFEGVTGVVAQPVKGAQKEGTAGLFKGVGKGLVGLIVRPTGGLIDLTSGTLDFVTRKTQVGSMEINDIRPPRFIGRDGVVRPFSADKALGTALLDVVDEGKFVDQFYHGRVELSKKAIVLVLDRSVMTIEKHILRDVLGDGGWNCQVYIGFKYLQSPPINVQGTNIIFNYISGKERGPRQLPLNTSENVQKVAGLIFESYNIFHKEF